MTQPTWIGYKLGGRYVIEQELGHGGMSTVYKATDSNLRRVVAVKLIHAHLSGDPEFVRRFEAEATVVASMRHPNIVQVYDSDHENQTYYIVFEFVPGETLQARLQRLGESDRRLSLQEVYEIANNIGDAIRYAHERDIVHRDVKPANVMLDIHGKAILTDFGIVKIVGGTTHTATGAVLGTARYLSPEQIKGEKVDVRSDIYSFGVMLYEMLGGRPPFDADSAMTLMMMHINDPIPDVRHLRPGVPPDLVALINKAMAKHPDQRYATMAELSADLHLVQADHPGEIQQPRPVERTHVTDLASPGRAVPRPEPGSGTGTALARTRSVVQVDPRALFVGGGVLVAAIIAILFLVFGSSGNGEDEAGAQAAAVASSTATEPVDALAVENADFSASPESTVESAGPPATSTATPPPTFTSTPSPSATSPPPTPTEQPTLPPATATATALPTATLMPTTTSPPPAPTGQPTPASPYYVRITSIIVNGDRYEVAYETTGYTETLPGNHVHFFFNTVAPDQAGVPGAGPWVLYGGPRPFTGYGVNDRPAGAAQMCALVAYPDHSVFPNSGNCMNLP